MVGSKLCRQKSGSAWKEQKHASLLPTLWIEAFKTTLSIKGLFVTFGLNDIQRKTLYIECHYAEWRDLFIGMPNVVILSVVVLSVVMLNVVMVITNVV
jgi:hypothetical protein